MSALLPVSALLTVFCLAIPASRLGAGQKWKPTIISEYDSATWILRVRITPDLDSAFRYDVSVEPADDPYLQYEGTCRRDKDSQEVNCEIENISTSISCNYVTLVQARDAYGRALSRIHQNRTGICIPHKSTTQSSAYKSIRSNSPAEYMTTSSTNRVRGDTELIEQSFPPWHMIVIIVLGLLILCVLATVTALCITRLLRRETHCWRRCHQCKPVRRHDDRIDKNKKAEFL